MKNKKIIMLIVGILLVLISIFMFLLYVYKIKDLDFECKKDCTGADLVLNVKIDKILKELTVTKTGTGEYEPYIPLDDVITKKYDKDFKELKIKLTKEELVNLEELYDLNKKIDFKDSALFMTVVLDLVYDNEDYCKKDEKCYEYYKKTDSNNDEKVSYREVGNFLFAKSIKYYKENDMFSANTNKLDLSTAECKTTSNSCTKEVAFNYDGNEHKVKIKYYYKVFDKKIVTYYDIIIDNKKIDSFKNHEYEVPVDSEVAPYVEKGKAYTNEKDLKNTLNFGGYLLSFDNNLGFLRNTSLSMDDSEAFLNIYQNNKKVVNDINISTKYGVNSVTVNKKSIDLIYPYCGEKKLVDLEFSIKSNELKTTEKSSKNMTETEQENLIGSDYCYAKDKKEIKLQTVLDNNKKES